MDDMKKMSLKSELAVLQGLVSVVPSLTAIMNNASFPVAGPIITIPAIPSAGQAIKAQNDVIQKLLTLLDKVLDAV